MSLSVTLSHLSNKRKREESGTALTGPKKQQKRQKKKLTPLEQAKASRSKKDNNYLQRNLAALKVLRANPLAPKSKKPKRKNVITL